MKYGVTKNTLLITAGIVWLLAGINILRIGISCWINDSHYWFFKVCEATIVFLLFFGLIFHKLYKKHTHRISQKKAKNCPFSFFDVKGWIVMAFMITIGILTRTLHLLPEAFIAVFYTGLSVALITTGTRFIWLLVEKQASTSLISHSVYRDFHDGCYFSLARWQRNLPKRNDSITNHSFKSHVSRNLQATLQVDITIRVNRRKSYHATLRFPHRAD